MATHNIAVTDLEDKVVGSFVVTTSKSIADINLLIAAALENNNILECDDCWTHFDENLLVPTDKDGDNLSILCPNCFH